MPATVSQILEALEEFYGPQNSSWPTEPYLYLVWLHCGYPASEDRCAKGWETLRRNIGVEPAQILAACAMSVAAISTASWQVRRQAREGC